MVVLADQLGSLVRGRARIAWFFTTVALGGCSGYVFGIRAGANEEPTKYHRGGRPDRQSEQEIGSVLREDRVGDRRKKESR